jgi:hypothetical protein
VNGGFFSRRKSLLILKKRSLLADLLPFARVPAQLIHQQMRLAGRLGQPVLGAADQHDLYSLLEADFVSLRDKNGLHSISGTQDRSNLLLAMDERLNATSLESGFSVFADQ